MATPENNRCCDSISLLDNYIQSNAIASHHPVRTLADLIGVRVISFFSLLLPAFPPSQNRLIFLLIFPLTAPIRLHQPNTSKLLSIASENQMALSLTAPGIAFATGISRHRGSPCASPDWGICHASCFDRIAL
ncbi:MAG: hypothetical protein WBJ68_07285 [Candidatus Dechloromonas phosphoritropha]